MDRCPELPELVKTGANQLEYHVAWWVHRCSNSTPCTTNRSRRFVLAAEGPGRENRSTLLYEAAPAAGDSNFDNLAGTLQGFGVSNVHHPDASLQLW